jgi:hypothetical protein
MTVTYGDVAKLGDRPGTPGVLSKLNDLAGDASLPFVMPVIDRYRIMRFVQLLSEELLTYAKLVGEIGRRYGEAAAAPSGFVAFSVKPEFEKDYGEEKGKLDAMECEGLATLKPLPLATYEKIPLTPRELACLEKFIVPPTDA